MIRVRIVEIEGEVADLQSLIDRVLPTDGRLPELPPAPAAADQDVHVHHWKIDTPNGPTSLARCACGEEKVVANSREAAYELTGHSNGGPDAADFPKGKRGFCRKCRNHCSSKAHKQACLGVA